MLSTSTRVVGTWTSPSAHARFTYDMTCTAVHILCLVPATQLNTLTLFTSSRVSPRLNFDTSQKGRHRCLQRIYTEHECVMMGTWKSAYRLLLQYYLSLVNKCKCLAGIALVVHHLQSCLCYYSELKLKKWKLQEKKTFWLTGIENKNYSPFSFLLNLNIIEYTKHWWTFLNNKITEYNWNLQN